MCSTHRFAFIFGAIFLTTLVISAHSTISTTNNHLKAKINNQHLHNLHKQIHAKEEELKEAEEINKTFERMIQFVNILGQVDNYLTERTKGLIKKLAVLVEDEDAMKRRFRMDSSEEEDN